ncbi:Dps family protein [Leucobacter chromiireducens]|uniref:Dps family protein n=1 Tax=Leucobacter chromiireducens TaxID=283877 RepID=UPI000F63136B|nr:DNA starvation/stationary phase protection protein [Leucobacter chromiireducens]
MATTQITVPAAQGELHRPSGVSQYLTPVVHDLIALSVNGKQAHWHVRGTNFIAVHELLDEVVGRARDAYDEVAERIVALGLPVDGRIGTVAARTTTPELADGFRQADDAIRDMVAQIDATLVTVYAAVKGLEEIDPVSQDIVIAIAQQLDKDRWFLASHVAA